MANRWIIYTLLLLLRFYGAYFHSLPGYIHPDEFFQGGQELFFGCQQRQHQPHSTNPTSEGNIRAERDNYSVKYVVDNIPWEFQPKNAIRSIVPPAFMILLPLRVYSNLCSIMTSDEDGTIDCPSSLDNDVIADSKYEKYYQLSGNEILVIPRLFMAFLSLLFLDGCLWILVKYTAKRKDTTITKEQSNDEKSGPPIEVIVLASSWPILVMATRPFTNALEAIVVSFLLVIVAVDGHDHGSTSNKNSYGASSFQFRNQCAIPFLIGMIYSIGLFVRFTFAFFALPIVLLFLYNRWRAPGNSWKDIGWNLMSMAVSFLITSLLFVAIDWYYYHYLSPESDINVTTCNKWSCYRDAFQATASKYVVPWNALRYNSKATNLAEHGLHPRITHALVNMPMMFGPLSLIGYFSCIRVWKEYASASASAECFRRVLCQATIISGLLVLSCAPHQEPRFLLPCIVPLVFLHGRRVVGMENKQTHMKKRVLLTALWVAFNAILYLFFGWLHQGGLVSSLLHLPLPVNPYNGLPETVIYYKTYMPPTFLARGRSLGTIDEGGSDTCNANNTTRRVSGERDVSLDCGNQVIIDLKGKEAEVLLEVLQERLHCHQRGEESLLLITPAPVMITLKELEWREYKFLPMSRHRVHVSTEDWPVISGNFIRGFFDQLELVTYNVSCA